MRRTDTHTRTGQRTFGQITITLHMYIKSIYLIYTQNQSSLCQLSSECSDIIPIDALPSLRQPDAVFTCHLLPSVSLIYTPKLPAILHPCFPSRGGFQQFPDVDEVLQPSCNLIQPYKPLTASAVSWYRRSLLQTASRMCHLMLFQMATVSTSGVVNSYTNPRFRNEQENGGMGYSCRRINSL